MRTKFLYLTLLFLATFFMSANAQYVNQIKISDLDADYVKIWSDNGPLLSSKLTIRVDYGQSGRILQVTDERRKIISFNSMIEVLNLFSKEGFELVEIVRDSKDETEFFYLKRKEM